MITIGIIAIVAAMTLPSMVQKYQEKVIINRLKKVYSTLSQLHILVSENDGTPADGVMYIVKTGNLTDLVQYKMYSANI